MTAKPVLRRRIAWAARAGVVLLPCDFIADSAYEPDTAASAEEEVASVLGRLKSPLGVYAVLGNHEWVLFTVRSRPAP